jgi:hypothetical protein
MNVQSQFFELIKNHYRKETFSLVDDLAELLHIERSTAYKRISGDTELKLSEIKTICTHYNVSLDTIIFRNTDSAISSFEHKALYKKGQNFTAFLMSIRKTFDSMRKGKDNLLLILSNDLPIFSFLGFPHLMYFSYLYCRHEGEHFVIYDNALSMPVFDKEELEVLKYMCEEYSNHPSTEVLSESILDYIINKIEFSSRMGMIDDNFKNKLYADLSLLCNHLESQCVKGKKINAYNGLEKATSTFLQSPFSLYGQNEIYYCTDGYEMAYIGNNVADYLCITDENYCKHVKDKINAIKNVSYNITTDNNLIRNAFFKGLRSKLKT